MGRQLLTAHIVSTAPTVTAVSATSAGSGAPPFGRVKSVFIPSISDILFVAVICLLFVAGAGWSSLLVDGDTGWHIRTGQYILSTGSIPARDLFSAAPPNSTWYAWEWLADVVLAWLHAIGGLKAVTLFTGVLAGCTVLLLFRHMLWRGAAVHVSLAVAILVAGALNFHFLARPHMFTTLFAVIAFGVLDRDLRKPEWRVWLLVPGAALWANLHGGFPVLIVAVVVYAVCAVLRKEGARATRYGALAVACSAATLANPYGWKLHAHMWEYLRSGWLTQKIAEYQSPVFRDESMWRFEVLLILGIACTLELVRRRRYEEALLIVIWAHASLISARHITIYVIAAAPAIACELTGLLERWTAVKPINSAPYVVQSLFSDMRRHAMRNSIWGPVFVGVLAFGTGTNGWPADFPGNFPTAILNRNVAALSGGAAPPILTSDTWAGYLEYRLYPSRRTFIDGRSDFFGPGYIKEYVCLRSACGEWERIADKYHFGYALIPPDWPLASAIARNPNWARIDADSAAILFKRRPE